MTPEEAKHEWLKEVNTLLSKIIDDTYIFMRLVFKGQDLVRDKQSGVTKELLQAMETGLKDLQDQKDIIHEVFALGSSKDAKDSNRDEYTMKLDTAKEVLTSLSDLKARGQMIIGN